LARGRGKKRTLEQRARGILEKQREKPLSARVGWKKRRAIIARYMRFVESRAGAIPAHDFPFNRATALLSERIALLMGADRAVQSQAFIAGFLHDLHRPLSNVPHAKEGAVLVQRLLERRYGKKAVERITRAVEKHDRVPANPRKNMVHASLALADALPKLGAIGAFRRSLFQAVKKENIARIKAAQRKAKQKNPEEIERGLAIQIILERTQAMTTKHWKPEKFPKFMQKYVGKQFDMHQQFERALQTREPWAIGLALQMFEAGKKGTPLRKAIEGYNPKSRIGKKFKAEAVRFIDSPESLF
jgi:hypothetical protein